MDRKPYLNAKQTIFQSFSKGVFTLKITRALTEANTSTLGIITKIVKETNKPLNSSMSMKIRDGTTSDIAVSTRTMQPQKLMHFY
jgi:hypothetical protein